MKTKQVTKQVVKEKKTGENAMRRIKIEKVVVSCGATGADLEKAKKLLELITQRKAQKIASSKRIPDFGVRPELEVGTRITVRNEEALTLLRQLLGAVENTIRKKSVSQNHFSFGIEEYIEIPGIDYQREIGIRGLNVTVDFARAGFRVKRKKIKFGYVPKKQYVTPQEIISYMEDQFKTKFS